jgi:hypothetical protein
LVTGASKKASSPAVLMAGGSGWLGRVREKERGFYTLGGVPRRLLGSFVAYMS